jgi:hypothetical protein
VEASACHDLAAKGWHSLANRAIIARDLGMEFMGTPDEFRRKAQDCIELAGRTANAVHRNMLLGLAVKWHQLASATRDEIQLTMNHGDQSAVRHLQARATASRQSAAGDNAR